MRTSDDDRATHAASREVDVGGLRVVVRDARPGAPARPPVVLVHGMMGGAWYWADWQGAFADAGWSTWAVNLRGHHGSRPVPDIGRVPVRDYVRDALDACSAASAAHGGVTPVIVGHSMGGFIAQAVAATRDAVAAAVLVSAAPPRGIPPLSWSLVRRQLPFVPDLLLQRPLVMSRADADALNFNRIPEADRAALFARLVPESGRAGLELSVGLPVRAADVRVPMLVIAGEDDHFLPARIARRVAAKYGAELATFPAHAHFIISEPGWEVPARHVLAWLDRTLPATATPARASAAAAGAAR